MLFKLRYFSKEKAFFDRFDGIIYGYVCYKRAGSRGRFLKIAERCRVAESLTGWI
jgi:hypothetical protein